MTDTRIVRQLSLRHVLRMTGEFGIFEHAAGWRPRREHGYCTDDNARLLLLATRCDLMSFTALQLADKALRFLERALEPDGTVHNRMNTEGRWTDEASVDDCWGRLVWASGSAVANWPAGRMRDRAEKLFNAAAQQRSPWLKASSFAALGASQILEKAKCHSSAHDLLSDYVANFPTINWSDSWQWPESRLTYANAAVAEALFASGHALGDSTARNHGLALLDWLLHTEMHGDRLSLTPAGGREPGFIRPAFDQQPIEAAAIADACARAWSITGDPAWRRGLRAAVLWFLGHNDSHQIMLDPASGGGFDGLTETGANLNQGAESTLAMIMTLQYLTGRENRAAY